MLEIPKAGAMADEAANAPASPPPTPKGVDFTMAQSTNATPIITSAYDNLNQTTENKQ